MNTAEKTRKILKSNNLIAKKCFGQNFLIDDKILQNIVAESNVGSDDVVIEVGPGLGNLTEYILETKAETIAFEIDGDMIEVLKNRFATNSLTIYNQDILKTDLTTIMDEHKGKNIRIIANLPYYITTPILFKLLEYADRIESITVMVQKEVADRITASPHSKNYGVLTIMTNYMADTQKLFDVPNTAFIPAPNVTSSVLIIRPNSTKPKMLGLIDEKAFSELVKKSFSARRKKIVNSLVNVGINGMSKEQISKLIKECGLNENSRAEDISIEQYIQMSNKIANKTKED